MEDVQTCRASEEVKEFYETKAGVKGLVDSGITKIPKFFIHPPESLDRSSYNAKDIGLQVPLIDLQGIDDDSRRKEMVDEIRQASEKWGFFQLVNHGVPTSLMDEMIAGVKAFHEQPNEVKMNVYSHDPTKPIKYFCNRNLLNCGGPADWRDTLALDFHDSKVDPTTLPSICRDVATRYTKHMIDLRKTLSQLLSEALGLRSDFLDDMECMETSSVECHYYPKCPEPELTLCTHKHTDPVFLTILVQDTTGGLQFLHENMWIDLPPVEGALLVNMGDFMQLITNDKFRSTEHRVLAQRMGPRVSAACFFLPRSTNFYKPYGPIKELLGDDKPRIYRDAHVIEYVVYHQFEKPEGKLTLPHFRLK